MAVPKNCLISIPDYGKAAVQVETLIHGLSIFNLGGREVNTQESRTGRHFFTTHRSSGGFTIEIIFTSHPAQENFHQWMEKYTRWAADPTTDASPARVVIPRRNFDKLGVLDGVISYGDQFGKVLYKTSLKFMGGSDPVDLSGEGVNLLSMVNEGENSEADLVRLQPAGTAVGSLNYFNDVGIYHEKDFQSGVQEFS